MGCPARDGKIGYTESMAAKPVLRTVILLIAIAWPAYLSRAQTTGDFPASADDSTPASSRPKPLTSRERAAARRATRDNALRAKREADRAKWVAKLKERGVEPWPESETDDQHAAALAKSRDMAKEVTSLFPGTQIHETEHFLFVSNMPPKQAGPFIASLDKMYEWMCRLYGVPRDHKVWLGGKAPIFAFIEKEQFDAFEDRFFPESRQSLRSLAYVYGLSHLSDSGEVVISCYRGNDPNDFAQMLVHETSHGFIHRYKTKARLSELGR